VQDLNDLYFFAKAAEYGGFAPAGRALGVGRPQSAFKWSWTSPRGKPWMHRLLRALCPRIWRRCVPREVIHVVFPSRRGLLPAVRALIDFLAERYATFCEE